ncbi:hypothetical protein TWF281_011316 [Arthrobotrys megalospora]
MTSLVELSKTPEIIYLILRYLPSEDLFSLLRTCKALYPACYRELWSTLVFENYTDEYTYTPTLLRPDRSVARPNILTKLIKSDGVESIGIKYTKQLGIGKELLTRRDEDHSSVEPNGAVADSDDRRASTRVTELNDVLADLLESGDLTPRVISLNLNIPNSAATSYPDCDNRLLSCLKKCANGKEYSDFSVNVQTYAIHQLPAFFNLAQITRLELFAVLGRSSRPAEYSDSWTAVVPSDSDDETVTAAEIETSHHIKELTDMLNQTFNLNHFTFADGDRYTNIFEISSDVVSKELAKFQTAITNLQYLKTLKLYTYIFHPSFFLIPPPSVRKLVYSGDLSPSWWRQFAACPHLNNVEYLKFYTPEDSEYFDMGAYLGEDEEDCDINEIILGDVAITGLKKFVMYRGTPSTDNDYVPKTNSKAPKRPPTYLPKDLKECILRNNKSLSKTLRTEIARTLARRFLQARTLDFYNNYIIPCTEQLANMNTIHRARHGAHLDFPPFSQQYLQTLLQNPHKRAVSHEFVSKMVEDCTPGLDLQNVPKNCVEIMQREYTRRYSIGEKLTNEQFIKGCEELKAIFLQHENTTDCQAAVNWDLKFPKAMEDMLDKKFKAYRGSLLEEYTGRFLAGESLSDPAEYDEIVEGWIRKVVKDVEQETAQKVLA